MLIAWASQQWAGSEVPQYAAWPSLIGPELMVNGDCGSATGWNLGAGFAIAGGKMTITAVTANSAGNTGVVVGAFLVDAIYRNVFTIDSISSGNITIFMAGTNGTSRTSAGTYSQDIVCSSSEEDWAVFCLNQDLTTATLDNFSVKSVGLMGVEADWSFPDANVFWSSQFLSPFFDGPLAGERCELTGASKTDFDAAVSNSTACTVTLYSATGGELTGTLSVTVKGGTPVNFVFNGTGSPVSHTVTSGTGSGFVLTAGNDGPSGSPARVQIDLAP